MNHKRSKRMTRKERKAAIVATLQTRSAWGQKWGTMYDIAKWTGMSASTHLLNYLYELVDEGRLWIHRDAYRPGVVRSWFSATEQIEQKTLLHVGAPGIESNNE